MPEPLLIVRDIIRDILGETTSGLAVIGGEGTRGKDEFDFTLADDVFPVTSLVAATDSLLSRGVPGNNVFYNFHLQEKQSIELSAINKVV